MLHWMSSVLLHDKAIRSRDAPTIDGLSFAEETLHIYRT